jgi:putative transposase
LSSDANREFHVFKGCHFDRSIILLCVRWYLAYGLSLRDLEDMMAERGIGIDHSTIHRWVIRFSPQLLKNFNLSKRSVTTKWHMIEIVHMMRKRQARFSYNPNPSLAKQFAILAA